MLKSPTNNIDSFKILGIICLIWSEKAGREAGGGLYIPNILYLSLRLLSQSAISTAHISDVSVTDENCGMKELGKVDRT